MTRRISLLIAASIAAIGTVGCTWRHYNVETYDEHPPARVVHVHSRSCGHYYDGDRWLSIAHGHAHGPGCGHYYGSSGWVRTGRTIVVAPAPHRRVNVRAPAPTHRRPARKVRVGHVHGPRCGHVWSHDRWIRLRGHHAHGPRCGHVFTHGRWSIR